MYYLVFDVYLQANPWTFIILLHKKMNAYTFIYNDIIILIIKNFK